MKTLSFYTKNQRINNSQLPFLQLVLPKWPAVIEKVRESVVIAQHKRWR